MTEIGSVIDRRFRVIDQIGEGGMSVVWLVTDTRLGKQWAVKEIKKNARTDTHKVIVESLRKEANLMKGLDHPALPRIVDIIEDGESLFVVMDFIQGEDLKTVIQDPKRTIREDDVIDWGIQLCDALQYLHDKGVVYRDMKPGNVMLQNDGTVKIIDFGIAREYDPSKQDDTMPLGTRGYASPEAFKKGEQTDARSDIYSLGVTLFHLATGHGPMEFVDQPTLPPIRDIDPSLSEGLEAIIIRATQWDRSMRYQSCIEMSLDLQNPGKLTAEYRKRLQRTVNQFKISGIIGVACLVIGIGCLFGSTAVRASSYDGLVSRAATASKQEVDGQASEAEELYLEAIDIDPSVIEPYRSLVDIDTDTGVYVGSSEYYPFTETESNRWKDLVKKNESAIKGRAEYADMCYDAGMLYFYYYDARGSQFGQMEAAANWFEKAVSAYTSIGEGSLSAEQQARYNAARNYVTICGFESKHKKESTTGNELAVTRDYFTSLKETIENMDDTVPAIVQLRLCDAAYTALSGSYLDELKDSEFTRSDALALLDDIAQRASEISGRSGLGASVSEIVDKLPKKNGSTVDDKYTEMKDRIEATYSGRYWEKRS